MEDEEAMAMAMAARGGGAARSRRGEPTGAGEEEKNTGEREGGENEKNRWRTHHRRVILQSGGDAYVSPPVRNTAVMLSTASPPGPFGTGGDRLSPPVRNKPAVMGRLR